MEVDSSGRPLLMCVKPTGTSTTLAIYRFTTAGGFDTSYSGDGKAAFGHPELNRDGQQRHRRIRRIREAVGARRRSGNHEDTAHLHAGLRGAPYQSFSGDGAASIVLPFTSSSSSSLEWLLTACSWPTSMVTSTSP